MHANAVGDRRLFNYSKELRASLLQNSKHAGLFQDYCPPPDSIQGPGATLNTQWKAWIVSERRRRLGWAVYVRVTKGLFLSIINL